MGIRYPLRKVRYKEPKNYADMAIMYFNQSINQFSSQFINHDIITQLRMKFSKNITTLCSQKIGPPNSWR